MTMVARLMTRAVVHRRWRAGGWGLHDGGEMGVNRQRLIVVVMRWTSGMQSGGRGLGLGGVEVNGGCWLQVWFDGGCRSGMGGTMTVVLSQWITA